MTHSLVLIDTSIWIDALSKKSSKILKNTLETLLLEQRVAITPLIKMELLSGTLNKKEFNALSEEFEALHQLNFTPEIWTYASELGFSLRRKGLKIPNTDLLISASALIHKYPLWHQDKHFEWIAQHYPLNFFS